MLIIEDDPYYFLQFDKVQKEFTRLLCWSEKVTLPSFEELKSVSCSVV